jgi:NAD(P)-dependent dehydrogenase (short-subunit alcohol dehydrogenase family)
MTMSIDLSGRKIIVTGGANGIGAACVRAYAEAGAKVVSLDLEAPPGRTLLLQLPHPENCLFLDCDVSSGDSVNGAFDTAVEFLGGLDVMANIAGIDEAVPVEEITETQMRRMLDIHVMGTFFTNQAAFRIMRETGGQIINFGSSAGVRGLNGRGHYGAAKGAVMAWTRNAALAWGKHNITVNSVAPYAYTRNVANDKASQPVDIQEHFDELLNAKIPLKDGIRRPETGIAPFMLFLASPLSNYITGQTLAVDGGVVMMGS